MIDPSSSEEESDEEQGGKSHHHHHHHHQTAKQSGGVGGGSSMAGGSGTPNALTSGGKSGDGGRPVFRGTDAGGSIGGSSGHATPQMGADGGGSVGGSSGHVTPQHLASNQHSNVATMQHGMGSDGSAINNSGGSTRDTYQRPYQSASGSSAEYAAGGNLEIPNKKMTR